MSSLYRKPRQRCSSARDGPISFRKNGSPIGRIIADHSLVKVRVVRQPQGTVQGIALRAYHPGRVYDLAPALADYLIAEGYALLEMRRDAPGELAEPERRRAGRPIIDNHRNGRRPR